MGVWKILGLIVSVIMCLLFMPPFLVWLGYVGPLKPGSMLVMTLSATVLVLKIILGEFAAGKIEYHKQGYDFCIITLGGSLSNAALQVSSSVDLFPGLSNFPLWNLLFKNDPNNIITQKVLLILFIFLVSCITTFVTVRISKAISDPLVKYKNLLSFINFAIGVSMFSAYVFTMVAK